MSDHELAEAVHEELDPTPAEAVDWPVSRRRMLQALASVGALSLGPTGAQGAAGTGIADEAFFSNYDSTSTASGYDLTIDGDVFAFDGSDTIGLPDGGTGTELVTPSGARASEVIGPDGNVVFTGIPDSVVTRYEFEDNSDATAAIDSVGSNDATLNGGSFSSDSAVGNLAWSSDGTDDYGVSQNTIDLSAEGTTDGVSVGGRFKPSKTGAFQVCAYWGGASDSYVYAGITDTDEWRAAAFNGTGTFTAVSGGSASTTQYSEVIAATDNTDLWLIVDGTEVARATNIDPDITGIGAENLVVARNNNINGQYYGGLSDNLSFLDDAVEASESEGAV